MLYFQLWRAHWEVQEVVYADEESLCVLSLSANDIVSLACEWVVSTYDTLVIQWLYHMDHS